MIRSRLGLKALGMCALVLGLMAVWAGAAQAEEPGGSWTYLNKAKELKTFEGALAEPSISGEIEKDEKGVVIPGVLHTKVLGGQSLLYECKAFTVNSGKLKPNGVVLGSLTFSECEAFLAGALSKNCNPIGGTIATNLIKAQMLLHKLTADGVVDKIVVATPEDAEGKETAIFATVKASELCAFGANTPIGGKFAIIPTNPTTHEVKHLIKEFAALTHLYVISDTPEHAANILGGAWAFLSGEHSGLEFAGLWK